MPTDTRAPASPAPVRYGFIGTGVLSAAMVAGLSDGVADPPGILVSPRNAEIAAGLARRFANVAVASDNQAVIDGSTVTILAVRPQDAGILVPLRFPQGTAVVSVMAGIPLARIAALAPAAAAVARAIPMPPVARRAGVTPVHPPLSAAMALFDSLGTALAVPSEAEFDAMSAVTGTVAAWFATLGTIAGWVERQGIAAADANAYVAAVYGGVAAALGEGAGLDHLARDHATPGGINEQFARFLRERGVLGHVEGGLDAILARLTGAAGTSAVPGER